MTNRAKTFGLENNLETTYVQARDTRDFIPESLSDEESNWILRLSTRGVELNNDARFYEAESCFAEAVRVVEESLGRNHPEVVDHLNRLAVSRFNNEDFAVALGDYCRLLGLVERIYGADSGLTEITRENIAACMEALQLPPDQKRSKQPSERILRSL